MKISIIFKILILGLISKNLLATTSVRLPDSENPSVFAVAGTTLTLKTDGLSSQPTTSSSPATFYVPVRTALTSNENRHISKQGSLLPTGLGGSVSGSIVTSLEISNNEGDRELYVAARRGSDTLFRVVGKHLTTITTATTSASLSFNISTACTNTDLDCTNLGDTNNSSTEVNSLFYFFLHDDDSFGALTVGGVDISPADSKYDDGIFFDGKFSNNVSVVQSVFVNMTELKRGDESLKAVYTGSGSFTGFDQVITFQHSDAGSSGTIGAANGAVINEGTYPAIVSGEITIGNLTNGVPVTISLAFADRFGFATNLSNPDTQTPEDILAFLEAQGCYLLSAGFQEEHYVIDYFKHIRDDYLLKNSVGKKFVKFYYATAPSFTHYIYQNSTVSNIVKGLGYIAYFIFNYIGYILLALFAAMLISFRRYLSLGKS